MTKKIKTLFGFSLALFSLSCDNASYQTQEGLSSYTFDKKGILTSPEEHTFYIYDSASGISAPVEQVLYHSEKVKPLQSAVPAQAATALNTSASFEYGFHRSIVGYRFSGARGLDYFEHPFLSDKILFSHISTALYLSIKSRLTLLEVQSLSVSQSTWLSLLRDYENYCQDCMELGLAENLEKLSSSKALYFWSKVKSKLGAQMSWGDVNLSSLSWVFLAMSPEFKFSQSLLLKEGGAYTFTAKVFHPTRLNEIYEPTSWWHDFTVLGSPIEVSEAQMASTIGHDQDLQATYTLSISMNYAELPTAQMSMGVQFENENRAAVLIDGQALPTIYLKAGQNTTVNLVQYFEDPDNLSEQLTLVLSSETDLFKAANDDSVLIYGPATKFNLGENFLEFKILDAEGKESQSHTLRVIIEDNTPPQILYAYKGTNTSVQYQHGDRIEINESDLDQTITLVSEDVDGDRTVVSYIDRNRLRNNFSYDPGRTFGVVEPRNGSWAYDYLKSGYFEHTPLSQQSQIKFTLRPSFYQVVGRTHTDYTLEFTVNNSSAYVNGQFEALPLTDSEKDKFNLIIRVTNKDDPPASQPSVITAPSIDENQNYSINVEDHINHQDRSLSSSTTSIVYRSKDCSFLSYSNGTVSGTPPLDAPDFCSFVFYIKDSASSLHGSALAPNDLRTPDFQLRVPIENVNFPPELVSSAVENLPSVKENTFFTVPLLDVTPDNNTNEGHFIDRDYNLSDAQNPFIDPREKFEFICEISQAGQNSYSECSSAGLSFQTNGLESANFQASYSLVSGVSTQDFDMRIGFKDRESQNYIFKQFKFSAENKPAPLIVNFSEVFKAVGENQTNAIKVRVERYSNDPIDVYPFVLDITCLGCNEIISSARSLDFTDTAYQNQAAIETLVLLTTDYTHGDGDGGKKNHVFAATAKSTNTSYATGSPVLTPEVSSVGQMILEVTHINRTPYAIEISGDKSTSRFTYTVDKRTKGTGTESLNLNILDFDPQDTLFQIQSKGLTGGAVYISGSKLYIDYNQCPLGGFTLTKNFEIVGRDASGASKARDVKIEIQNVDTFSANCR